MNKVSIAFALLVFTVVSVTTFYVSAEETRKHYAVLDVDMVVSKSKAYQKFKILWDREGAKYQKEIEFYESQMHKLDNELHSKENLSKDALKKIQKQIGEHEVKIQKLIQRRKNQLDGSFSEAINKLRITVDRLVHDYVSSHDIDLVIPKSQTIYISETIDITDIIVNNLNDSLEKLDVQL